MGKVRGCHIWVIMRCPWVSTDFTHGLPVYKWLPIGSFCNYPWAAASNPWGASTAEAAHGRSVSVYPSHPRLQFYMSQLELHSSFSFFQLTSSSGFSPAVRSDSESSALLISGTCEGTRNRFWKSTRAELAGSLPFSSSISSKKINTGSTKNRQKQQCSSNYNGQSSAWRATVRGGVITLPKLRCQGGPFFKISKF